MKFSGFKIGKSKEKNSPQEETGTEIVNDLLKDTVEDDAPVRHHAPIQELSLEPEEEAGRPDVIPVEETEIATTDEAETIKLVEVQAEPTTPAMLAPKEVKKEEEKLDLNTSISNIFTNIEDEENPMMNLIKSLPDVAATELIDDLKEINDIIKDWQKK